MKRKRNTLCCLLFILAITPARAQLDDFGWMDFPEAGNRENGKLTGTKYNYAFRGNLNYFYNNDWYPGSVTTTDGRLHSGYNLRYDAYNDELVALNTRVKGLFVVDKSLIQAFTIEVPGVKPRLYRKIRLDEFQQKEHFFEVLYEGGVTLVSRNRITEHKTSAYKNKHGELDDREYRAVQHFYLLKADGSFLSFPEGRKSILNLFPEMKKEIRQLLRRHFIDNFSPDGLPGIIALLEHEKYF